MNGDSWGWAKQLSALYAHGQEVKVMTHDFALWVCRMVLSLAINLEKASWAICDGVSGKSVWDRKGWESAN